MADVNAQAEVAEVADAPQAQAVEADTTQPVSQQVEKTTEVQPEAPKERMIPYQRFTEVNKGLKEAQRKLAEYEQRLKLGQYDENDMNAIMSHPFVQELLIKQAKSELTEYAKGRMDELPQIPEPVKKAILKNVRGFVKETTTDVESAKIDIDEYIDELLGDFPEAPAQQPKVIPVMSTKQQETAPGAKPLEVQEILEKPVDEWTEEEAKLVEQYKKSMPKR